MWKQLLAQHFDCWLKWKKKTKNKNRPVPKVLQADELHKWCFKEPFISCHLCWGRFSYLLKYKQHLFLWRYSRTLTRHLGTRWRWTARQFNSRPFKKQICAHKNPQHFSFLPWNQIANVLAASVAWASRSEVKQVTLPSMANFYCTVNMQTACVLRSCLFRLIHSSSLAAFSSSQTQKFSVHLSITVARKQQPRPQRCHSKRVSALLSFPHGRIGERI